MKGFISEDRHPFLVLLLLLAFMLGGYFVASFIYLALVTTVLGIEVMDLTNLLANPTEHPEAADALLLPSPFWGPFEALATDRSGIAWRRSAA